MMRGPDRDIATAISAALDGSGHYGNWGDLPHGAVVCTAVLTGAYQCGRWVKIGDQDMWTVASVMCGSRSINSNIPVDPYGDYSPGRWAWRLEDVRRLAVPEPARGKQGWWEWTPMCPADPSRPAASAAAPSESPYML